MTIRPITVSTGTEASKSRIMLRFVTTIKTQFSRKSLETGIDTILQDQLRDKHKGAKREKDNLKPPQLIKCAWIT